MKKEELKSGMIVQTTHNRFGVVELKENRIDFCYDPDSKDEYKSLNRVSLDDVVEINEKIGIGGYVTEDLKQQYSNLFEHLKVGDPYFAYETAPNTLERFTLGTVTGEGILKIEVLDGCARFGQIVIRKSEK